MTDDNTQTPNEKFPEQNNPQKRLNSGDQNTNRMLNSGNFNTNNGENEEESRKLTSASDSNGGWYGDSDLPIAPVETQPTRVIQPPYKRSRDETTRTYQPPSPNISQPVPVKDINNTRISASSGIEKTVKQEKSVLNTASGCFFKTVLGFLLLGILSLIGITSFAIYQYYSIAASLPTVGNLRQKASSFETTRIMDRNGGLLYEINDPNAGRRTYVSLDKISPYLIAATIATEDKEFYNHPGYDPVAIIRALLQNYLTGETVSGASTITQQLARTLLLSSEERNEKTVQRKAREIVLAAEITRKYTKEEILELYLNEIYYGNMAYGIEAASNTYFHSSAETLNLAQATFLAGIPQAPAVHDIFSNRDETLFRHKAVLQLMYDYSKQKGCVEVSNNVQPVCVDAIQLTDAAKEIENYPFQTYKNEIQYPHWVNYVRSVLEKMYDSQTIYRSGFTVITTLDPVLQNEAEKIVKQHVNSLVNQNVNGGALVAIRPNSGEILAMVGSPDFNNENNSGQVNMAINPRQPGSSIKPLTYIAAFEKGWTPATLIWDVPSEFPPSGDPGDTRETYKPVNYDGKFHGPVTVRTALANSYNIPAVKTLNYVGIYNDPNDSSKGGFLDLARRMGITTLNRDDYGLSLTLGGGEVTLLELTSAYSIFANDGRKVSPVAITKITDISGQVVYEYKPSVGEQAIRSEHAYLINSILSDNKARSPMFGENSVLNLPFQAAVKTGTTNDFRDNWTLGYTPDLAVGVWVGNPDYTAMQNTTGLTGAAPIWSQFMTSAIQSLTGGNPKRFPRPAGIVDKTICEISGAEPSEWCPSSTNEIFANDQMPLSSDKDLWQEILIDSWTGLRYSSACPDFSEEKFAINVTDSTARKWLTDTDAGRAWANAAGFPDPIFFVPKKSCKETDPRPTIRFEGISEGETINSGVLEIYGVVTATENFGEFSLYYGKGESPSKWNLLVGEVTKKLDEPEIIYKWFLDKIESGIVTLKIHLDSTTGTSVEKTIHLNLRIPTQTPTLTPTPTETPTMTPTPTATEVPPTETVTPTVTLTVTPTP